MSMFVRLLVFAAIAGMPALAAAVEPERPGQEAVVKRAAFAEQHLWLLSNAGELSSVADAGDTRVAEVLAEKVIDLCVRNGHPVVITGANDGSAWTLRQRSDGAWSVAAVIQREGDGWPLAMECGASHIALLTTQRLIDLDGSAQSAVTLSGKLDGRVWSTYATADHFFVGFNQGEWGGGLRRIDRRTGDITVIERNSSGELCGGPLNTDCDPVTGITAAPGKADCVVAAIGLVHLASHGRVVEICGARVERLYFKPRPNWMVSEVAKGDEEPYSTVAFFGLARAGDTLWAMGTDGLHGIEPDGRAARIVPLPRFKDIGGIGISFNLPGFVLVLRSVDPLGAAIPLLVPR